MKRVLLAFAVVTALQASDTCGTCGAWKLGRIVGWSEIGTDEKSARKLIGRVFLIDAKKEF